MCVIVPCGAGRRICRRRSACWLVASMVHTTRSRRSNVSHCAAQRGGARDSQATGQMRPPVMHELDGWRAITSIDHRLHKEAIQQPAWTAAYSRTQPGFASLWQQGPCRLRPKPSDTLQQRAGTAKVDCSGEAGDGAACSLSLQFPPTRNGKLQHPSLSHITQQ